MLGLRDCQRAIAVSLMSDEMTQAADLICQGGVPSPDRLRIHRNTMLGVLINALALTYPAVQSLVGEDFFAQVARSFIFANPPRTALLTGYGGSFPRFLAGYSLLDGQPYLSDVARLEWAIDEAARDPADQDGLPLADVDIGGTRLTLIPSLKVVQVSYPAEPIWRAALDNDGDALSRIDSCMRLSLLAVWHDGYGARVASLGSGAASLLEELIAGGDVESAINAAAAADPSADPIAAVTSEILLADFARLFPSQ
jgi:Putative DNA-binding domain